MNKKEKVEKFLKEYFDEPIQAFNTKNLVGDSMLTIFREDEIRIEYCYEWNYIEIFGLPITDFKDLKKEGKVIY